jgi:hypothetical protein
MAITEKTYTDMLKETVMLKHVGSGPVDPAPKEKETKSPVVDSKGEGTQQAGTKDPNKIPALSALKKELAKEGVGDKILNHKNFITVLEHIFSKIGKENLEEMIKDRTLPTTVAKYILRAKNK